jgi:hypothetical protein
MGYFSNGTDGQLYQEEYCERCLFDNYEKGVFCPIWNLHLSHNYEECNNKGSFLHALIPRDGVHNGRCKFFVDRGALTNLQIEKIEHDLTHSPTEQRRD